MKRETPQGVEKYTKEYQSKKRWYKLMTALSCVVVFCTVYAMILPAITIENRYYNTSVNNESYSAEDVQQGDLQMVLPEGAQIPAGYDVQYRFIDPDNRFGVEVYAPKGALPEEAVLSAKLLEEDSEEYAVAEQAIADAVYDGFAAMDIHFLLDGKEIEPDSGVYVCINAAGVLPKCADPESLAVQHHAEKQKIGLLSFWKTAETTVETVADSGEENGSVAILDSGDTIVDNVAAAFEVDNFSTFTVTWQETYKLILHYVDAKGDSIYSGDSQISLATYSELERVTLSQYVNRINHKGYAYQYSYVYVGDKKQTVSKVGYDKNTNKWVYFENDVSTPSYWLDGTNYTADVYLLYKKTNDLIPKENNVYPVDAINVWDNNANVILLYPKLKSPINEFSTTYFIKIREFFKDDTNYIDSEPDLANVWYAYRIENRGGRYQVIQRGDANADFAVQKDDGYILLVKKSYFENYNLYYPTDNWPSPQNDTTIDGSGDTVQINLLCKNTDQKTSNGTTLAYLTFSSKDNNATAAARDDDVSTVTDSAIKFRLFDYSSKINRPNGVVDGDQTYSWRKLAQYYNFRGQPDCTYNFKNGNRDERYDADAFTVNHATVERVLDENNNPVLDPNRNALGGQKEPEVTEEKLPMNERSLAYLFGENSSESVKAYNPSNTILQKIGSHYYYDSRNNAVDYDKTNQLFRVRNYVERSISTAGFSNQTYNYYDFLPFNYTGGTVIGTQKNSQHTYNIFSDLPNSSQVNYWFGMRMDVEFYQSKDGLLNGEEMVFRFSGDDDIWVFIDDVLVLDLGGTHGAVTGTINFATGKVEQYLDWLGEPTTVDVNSFPTTIKKCYQAAEREPNGGFNGDIFADYTKHKLSLFYIERGAYASNCSMDFNLPTQPEKSLQVTKELAAEPEADKELVDKLHDSTGYKFRVVKADANGNPTDNLLIKEGETFTRTGAGVTEAERTGVVGEDGFFTLKRGQTAEFTNMLSRFDGSSSDYIVQEFLPDDLNTQFKSVLYNVNSVKYPTSQYSSTKTGFTVYSSPVLSAGEANLVVCRNVVDTAKLSNLSITKKQVGSLTNGQPEYYYMKVSFGSDESSLSPISVGTSYFIGDETYYVQQAGIINLAAGKTANLKLILGTHYKVEEVAEANGTAFTGTESYTATYSGRSIGSIAAPSSNVEITVTNTYPNGSLSLKKTVTNTDDLYSHGEFTFEISFPVSDGWSPVTVPISYSGSSQRHDGTALQFEKIVSSAVATVKLYHDETVVLSELPSEAVVTIKELADGYAMCWKVNGSDSLTKDVAVTIPENRTVYVECINTTGYELPQTGGIGTALYTAGGFLLTISAAFILIKVRKYY